ncbi:nuclear transport factor 2 family protein [Limibaculum sp. FT325]|uniref:ester cyclase n=1 Tax=Thermohalobaculum sediminis TaxID=2939436 RepID=UPI0020BE292B|nr:nuclear transport factor 2 family protein [Limibaculum sediminis]MCL5777216.1 nuclear transport factor 2 family protein [Limibaculum sediminis]
MPPSPSEIRAMAERYAAAWSAHDPDGVAAFYAPGGRISINHGEPTVGRAAIADVARAFYGDFPDLVVHCDGVRSSGNTAIFLWTLEGTNSGAGGSGNRVRISGWEFWTLTDAAEVEASLGFFDAADYDRQLGRGRGVVTRPPASP